MISGIFQSIVIPSVALAFYLVDFLLIRRFDHRRNAAGSGRSWDFTLAMLLVVMFLAAQPVWLPFLSLNFPGWFGLFIQVAGLLLLVFGLALHWWSRRHLQQFYAERVELQPGHRVIESGPYAYVRHPVFTSFFMFVTGLLLVNPSLPVLLLSAYTFWDFTRAAHQEEDLLSASLPGYRQYMRRTQRFFPRLVSRRGVRSHG